VAAVVAFSGVGGGLRGEGHRAGSLAELTSACGATEAFFAGNTILVGEAERGQDFDGQHGFRAFPGDSPIRAYEEHARFVCAEGHASVIAPRSSEAKVVRRFFWLKPGIFLVDDLVRAAASGGDVRWVVSFRSEPTVVGHQLRLADGDESLVCETVWPDRKTLQRQNPNGRADASVYSFEVEQKLAEEGARFLHVFHLSKAGDTAASVRSVLEEKDGGFDVAVFAPEGVFRVTLPPPGTDDAGWIAVEDTDGKTLVPQRPFASGVLPHGPEGMRLLERWDSAYRGDRQAGWDTGSPAPELKRVIEGGFVKPCRTAVLGCGSGTNAVYLAQKGFEVTAIDVAPTALGIAAGKAEKAGVDVRWVLADVLALPELETFDFIFDRGCYHNVRYVDAAGFVGSLRRLSRPGTRCLILSLNRDSPPGVREQTMRDDLESLYEFEWLRDSGVESRDGTLRRESWSLMLRRRMTGE